MEPFRFFTILIVWEIFISCVDSASLHVMIETLNWDPKFDSDLEQFKYLSIWDRPSSK